MLPDAGFRLSPGGKLPADTANEVPLGAGTANAYVAPVLPAGGRLEPMRLTVITDTVSPLKSARYAYLPSGLNATFCGTDPAAIVGVVASTVFIATSITDTLLPVAYAM